MTSKLPRAERVSVAIVGTGFSGLCMAIKLKEAGIHDFVLLERGDAIGGTWRDNTYPGCACDVPSHLYSYSFAPSASWTRAYAPQPEIRAYLEKVARDHDLHRHVRFRTKAVSATLDEARGLWTIVTDGGETIVAGAVAVGIGALSNPAIPSLPGRDRFRGPQFHSATWRHDVDLRGKRVAVVGTGASAIQFVPEIQPVVAELTLFQRTPPWVLPRPDRPFSDLERRTFEHVPGARWLYRQSIYWRHELRHLAFLGAPQVMKLVEKVGKRHIARAISDPVLRTKLTPDYTPGCKRILMSNEYYPALAQPNVHVETSGIAELREDAIVTKDGRAIPADVVIYGTGFTVHDYLGGVTVKGRGGADLGARWANGAEAYLGTTVHGFPGLYMLMGPNTGLGHNSMVVMIEAQVRYAIQHIRLVRERGLAFADVREDVQRRYNDDVQHRLARTVWSSGCHSWYLNEEGKNTTLWPGFTFEFAARTLRLDPSEYELVPPHEVVAAPHDAPAAFA